MYQIVNFMLMQLGKKTENISVEGHCFPAKYLQYSWQDFERKKTRHTYESKYEVRTNRRKKVSRILIRTHLGVFESTSTLPNHVCHLQRYNPRN